MMAAPGGQRNSRSTAHVWLLGVRGVLFEVHYSRPLL
jgi:hypothetical protein